MYLFHSTIEYSVGKKTYLFEESNPLTCFIANDSFMNLLVNFLFVSILLF